MQVMKMNKVLVKLYVPIFETQYDVWIPLNKRIHVVIDLLIKVIDDFYGGIYNPKRKPVLYNKLSGEPYDINLNVKEAGIKNSTEIVLI